MKKNLFIILLSSLFFIPNILIAQQKKNYSLTITKSFTTELSVINDTLYVQNARLGTKIQIFTIIGKKICEIEMKSNNGIYELNLPKAIYIFKLEDIVRKFVIR